MTGTVSHYRIVRELGGGGMGVVYVAEDIRLGRPVALKFLPDHLAANPEALERFSREARTASSLNHPNICTLYDIDEYDGKPFLVMELLEGENLKQRLARGAMASPELLEWGIQIGGALQAAHSKGIVHRDIKPANLFIVRDGHAKVLDFGLAKPIGATAKKAAPSDLTVTMAPNFQSTPGMAAGTLGYMSPEQARGEEVDARTDLFSFGAVLYEMATGHEPFAGATSAVVFDAILNRDPAPLRSRQPAASLELERVIGKALEKDRNLRYQSAADLVADLQRLRRDSSSGFRLAAVASPATSRRYRGVVVGLCLAVLAAAGVLWWSAPRTAPPLLVPVKVTGNPAELPVLSAVLSPDGRYLAFSDRLGIHIRASDTGESRALPDTAGMAAVVWSADSTQLFAARSLGPNDYSVWTIPLLGGSPRAGPRGLPSPDGRYLVTAAGVESADGSRVAVANRGRVDQIVGFGWSPDSTHVAIGQSLPGASPVFMVVIVEPETGQTATAVRSDVPIAGIAWLSNTRLAFAELETAPPFNDFNLWTVDLPRRLGGRIGEPKRLTQWSGFQTRWLSATSDGKRLAFLKDDTQNNVDIARLEAGGTRIATPRRLTLDDHYNNATAWMPDNRAVLFESNRTGVLHIYRQQLDSVNPELIIGGPNQQFQPRLSPDHRWLLYLESPDFKTVPVRARLLRMPLDGGRAEEVLVPDGSVRAFQCSLTPRGLCVVNELRGSERVVSLFDPLRGRGREVTRNPLGVGDAAISPDGSRIALAFGEPLNRIRLLTLEGKTEQEITVTGATRLIGLDWAVDGRSLFCGDVSDQNSTLLRVEFDGSSHPLWAEPGNHPVWAVPSPDGRLLALRGATESVNVWTAENR